MQGTCKFKVYLLTGRRSKPLSTNLPIHCFYTTGTHAPAPSRLSFQINIQLKVLQHSFSAWRLDVHLLGLLLTNTVPNLVKKNPRVRLEDRQTWFPYSGIGITTLPYFGQKKTIPLELRPLKLLPITKNHSSTWNQVHYTAATVRQEAGDLNRQLQGPLPLIICIDMDSCTSPSHGRVVMSGTPGAPKTRILVLSNGTNIKSGFFCEHCTLPDSILNELDNK
jgi:hypothetical protein